ncbi:MAG: transcriptional regulator NanR [Bryobacteraceae bacterium]|nr:transcriptional regulator NanR [Bryobacteraceae bacterium]
MPSEATGRIVRRKLADEVLDRLLAMIEAREVAAGGQLPSERELMRRFGVGRPAVREAMQSLESMGLIEIQHGERARLKEPGPRTLLDQIDRTVRHLLVTSPDMRAHLLEARLLFETGMVALAAARASEEDLARLGEALATQEGAAGDPARFVAADMAFHKAIAEVGRNPIYTAVSEAMLQWAFTQYPRMLRVKGAERLTLSEHRAILERVRARDGAGAAEAMRAHLMRANPQYAISTRA